jgi:hypothetical protein
MDKKLLCYIISGVIFTFLAGTLLHFTYEWSGNNFWVGLFSPVNESTWEHMKLLFFPMLFYSIASGILLRLIPDKSLSPKAEGNCAARTISETWISFFLHLKNSYPCICLGNALGILLGTISIPVLFYTYSGILGTHCLFMDIAVFFLSIVFGFACAYWFAKTCTGRKFAVLFYSALALFMLCFFLFTIFPPDLGIFTSAS